MSIDFVEKSRQCMRCGMCASVCPTNSIQMEYDSEDGFYHPSINNKCVGCGKCEQTCPALNQRNDSLMGIYKKLYLAHATDRLVRHWATSGGVINALVRYILEKDIVEAVLMTRYTSDNEVEAEPIWIEKSGQRYLLSQTRDYTSRYVLVPVLSKLKEGIQKYKKIAVVGTPCQLKAMETYGGGIHDLDVFKIGITCSGGMSYKATEQYKQSQSMETSKMYYRGDGWPGKNCLVNDDGTVEYPHQGSMFEQMFSSQIFKNPGCRGCKDHFAECADISFCDFWDTEERKTETEGNSCVIIRSEKGYDLFTQLVGDRYIDVVRTLDENEILDTQLQVVKAKKGNLHSIQKYRIFCNVCDLTFKYKIYRLFNQEMYQKFCFYYSKICRDIRI